MRRTIVKLVKDKKGLSSIKLDSLRQGFQMDSPNAENIFDIEDSKSSCLVMYGNNPQEFYNQLTTKGYAITYSKITEVELKWVLIIPQIEFIVGEN